MSANPILEEISHILNTLPPRNLPGGLAVRQDRAEALEQYQSQREALAQAVSEVIGKLDNMLQLLNPHSADNLLSVSDYLTAVATAFHSAVASRNHKLYTYMQRSEQRRQDAISLKQLAERKAVAFERWASRPGTYTVAQARVAIFEVRTAVGNLTTQPDPI